CIPDVVVTIEDPSSKTLRLIIENKIGAGQTGDQLADYWQAGNLHYCGQFRLIYLTDHRYLPKGELEESERHAGANAQIYWLNWHLLFLWIQRQRSGGLLRPYSEQQILLTLHSYLAEKGYQTFDLWRTWAGILSASYYRKYVCSCEPFPGGGQYVH